MNLSVTYLPIECIVCQQVKKLYECSADGCKCRLCLACLGQLVQPKCPYCSTEIGHVQLPLMMMSQLQDDSDQDFSYYFHDNPFDILYMVE
jgi:hypothetical protein